MASIYDIVGNNGPVPNTDTTQFNGTSTWGNQFGGPTWGNNFNTGAPNANLVYNPGHNTAFDTSVNIPTPPPVPTPNDYLFGNGFNPNQAQSQVNWNNHLTSNMLGGAASQSIEPPRGTPGQNTGNRTGDAGIGATGGTPAGTGGTGGNPGTPANPATPPPNQFNPQQQAWMNANQGWQADIMKAMLGGQQFGFDPMNIQWQNFNNGNTENITRAMGILNNPAELAKLMGGEAVQSPFATFGTQQRDQYIKMPNGQMIDASAMAQQLSGAMGSANPFSSLSDVLNLYGHWANTHTNDPNVNTDAINLVQQGVISPNAPPNWDPSQFAGGNPTYTPSGPVPGNPSNPGMGTSNPIQFQGGQMNYQNGPNGFPIFNNTNGNIGTGTTPTPNSGTPQVPQVPQAPQTPTNPNAGAPQGVNQNNQYYLAGANNPRAAQGGLYGQAGLASTGGGGGGFGAGLYNQPGGTRGAQQPNQPFVQPKPSGQVAGNLPNGTSVLGK
jgi:hypothetical protein